MTVFSLQITFRSEIGTGTRSDIAIDDIAITTGDCEDDGGTGNN